MDTVGVQELRQNLGKHLARVKEGEALLVTERGREVAMLVPPREHADLHAALVSRFGATMPVARLETIAAGLDAPGAPGGTTDEYLAESRGGRY